MAPPFADRVLYVKHNNKAGGSTLCAAAKRAGVPVPELSNCNGDSAFASCVKEESLFLSDGYVTCSDSTTRCRSRYRAVFNEGTLWQFHPERYVYVTSIRHPVVRVISQMLHHWERELEYSESGEVVNASAMLWRYIRKHSLHGRSSKYLQNMQTRQIASGKLNLTEAKRRLRQFALVIPTEEMDRGVEAFLKLVEPLREREPLIRRLQRKFLGGANELRSLHRNKRDAGKQLATISREDPGLVKRLGDAEREDDALHHFARKLFGSKNYRM